MVSYDYDAWGKLTKLTDDSGKNLGEINPFRYRGYYYDEDTSWYYLQSRYYDVEVGRFLNADDVHYLGEEGINCNLFTYCVNNPVNNKDENGMLTKGQVVSKIVDFCTYAVTWIALKKNIKIASYVLSAVGIVSGIWQYSKDSKKCKGRELKVAKAALIICVVSNFITICLTKFNLLKSKSYIKKFLWYLGTSIAMPFS